MIDDSRRRKADLDKYVKQYLPFYNNGPVPLTLRVGEQNIFGFYNIRENRGSTVSIVLREVDIFNSEEDLVRKVSAYRPLFTERKFHIGNIDGYGALATIDPKKFPEIKSEEEKMRFLGIPIEGILAQNIHLKRRR